MEQPYTCGPVCVCLYLAGPGLVLLVLSGDLRCSALQGFEFDVAGNFSHKRTADIPFWLLKHQVVTQNTHTIGWQKSKMSQTAVCKKKEACSDQALI